MIWKSLPIILLLTSCALIDEYGEARELVRKANEICSEKLETGEYVSHEQRAECIGKENLSISEIYGVPYKDMTHISNAIRIALARKIDTGKIELNVAKNQMIGAGYILDSEEENRIYAKAAYPREKWQSQEQLISQVNAENLLFKCKLEGNNVLCE